MYAGLLAGVPAQALFVFLKTVGFHLQFAIPNFIHAQALLLHRLSVYGAFLLYLKPRFLTFWEDHEVKTCPQAHHD